MGGGGDADGPFGVIAGALHGGALKNEDEVPVAQVNGRSGVVFSYN